METNHGPPRPLIVYTEDFACMHSDALQLSTVPVLLCLSFCLGFDLLLRDRDKSVLHNTMGVMSSVKK